MRSLFLAATVFLSSFYSTAQVNLPDGSANQNISLVNYVDGKAGLAMNVGLNYSSGNGLLVNDIASNVGTGWNLAAGGVIVRAQNGEPDDQVRRDSWVHAAGTGNVGGIATLSNQFPDGYLYTTSMGCNAGLNYYPSFKDQSVYKELNGTMTDVQQDKFIFYFNGQSGTFVINKGWQIQTLGDTKLKIVAETMDMTSQRIRTKIYRFHITTEDGVKYTFSEKSATRVCRYKYSVQNRYGVWVPESGNPSSNPYAVNRFYGYPLPDSETPYVINGWFLSQVENLNNGQKIILNYQDVHQDEIVSKLISHERDLNKSGGGGNANWKMVVRGWHWYSFLSLGSSLKFGDLYSWNLGLLNALYPSSTSVFYHRSIVESKRITSINFPNGGVVSFGYSSKQRLDLPQEYALENIKYSINGKSIRAFKLSYGYFYLNTIRPYNTTFSGYQSKFARLCLLSVQNIGTGEDEALEPPYKFSYYTGSLVSDDIVPARNFLAQDHWGYYNGNKSTLPLQADHDFFINDEPTNYFKTVLPANKNPKAGYAKNGLLRTVTYPTGGVLEYSYNQITNTVVPPPETPYTPGGVAVSKTMLYDGEDHSKDIINDYGYKYSDNSPSRWGEEAPTYYGFSIAEYNIKCFQGRRFKYPGLSYPELAVSTSIDWGKVIGKMLIKAAIKTGIHVIVHALAISTSVIPIINAIVFAIDILMQIIDCIQTYAFHRFILSNVNHRLANSLSRYFSSVEVKTNSPTGNNGRTFYTYTDWRDYPVTVPVLDWPFTQYQRMASWIYGNPRSVTVYDKTNHVVKEIKNTYNNIVAPLTGNNINAQCATIDKEALRGDNWEAGSKNWFTWGQVRWMTPIPYTFYTGRTELVNTTDKSYVNQSLVASVEQMLLTDTRTLLPKIKLTEKDVNTMQIDISYYPTDYAPNDAVNWLVGINAIRTPVATETWLLKTNGVYQYTLDILSASVIEYKKYLFNNHWEVKPWKTYELKSKSPIPLATIGGFNGWLRNPVYYKVKSEMIYDIGGNLVQVNSDDMITSFVNDYSDRYVVATISNAAYSDIAYTSFESNGKGNWLFNSATIQSTTGLTGFSSFPLSSTNSVSRSGLNASQTYNVTYWVEGNQPVLVNGVAGDLQFQVGNWKLYKHTITNTTAVSLSGNATIDELRLCPSNALMSTVAYKDGVGKVAECDVNNRIFYYEYDGLGRLKLTRDQNRNIIKTYEYNYKQ